MESITITNTEINTAECFKEKLFTSRLSLKFEDPQIENSFNFACKAHICQLQSVITGVMLILCASAIILFTALKKEKIFFLNYNFTAYICLSGLIMSTSFIILCLNFWKGFRECITSISFGLYLVLIGLVFHLVLSLVWSMAIENEDQVKDLNSVPDVSIIIIALSYISQALCIFIYDISFISLLCVAFLQICVNFLFNYFLFYQRFLIYTFSQVLFLLAISLIWYVKSFIRRIDFFICLNTLRYDLSDISFFGLSPIENIKHSYFVVDINGKISYMNKSCKKLARYIERYLMHLDQKYSPKRRETVPCIYEEEAIEPLNLASLVPVPDYWRSFLSNDIKLTHFRKAGQQMSFANETKILEMILNGLVNINEDLPYCLYKYLKDLKDSKEGNPNQSVKDKEKVSTSTLPPVHFILEQFCELANPDINRRKSETLFSTKYSATNKATTYNKTDFESMIQNTLTLNPLTSTLNISESINPQNQYKKSPTNIRVKTLTNSSSYIYIGKSVMKLKSSTSEYDIISKEFDIFYRVSGNRVEFLVEDYSQLLLKIRKDTVIACRALFLSKIAHEFRNPICNILEIVNFLNDEIHKDMTKSYNNSEIEIDISSNNSSSNMIDNRTENNCRNVNIRNLSSNLILLRNVCEIMQLLLKDFTFYSKHIDEEESYFEKGQHLEVEESCTKTEGKQCEYKKILQELVGIFSMKANTDRKDNKLKIVLKLSDTLPEIIDCDKEIFTSLMFNLMYHAYKTTQAGMVTISVSLQKQLGRKKYLFEITILGVSKTGNLVKIMKSNDIIKNIKYDDIDELEEEHSSSNNNSSCKDGLPRLTIMDGSCSNVKNNTSKNDNITIPAGELTSNKNMSNLHEIVDLEKLHLKRLFEVSDICKRNSIIDEFNNNFSIYISHIYAKKLYTELQMENTKHDSKLFFYVDAESKMLETLKIALKNEKNAKTKDNNVNVNANANENSNANAIVVNSKLSHRNLSYKKLRVSFTKGFLSRHSSNTVNNIISKPTDLMSAKLELKPIFLPVSRSSPADFLFKGENAQSENVTNRETVVNSNLMCMNYSIRNKVVPAFKTQSSCLSSETDRKKIIASANDRSPVVNQNMYDKAKSGNFHLPRSSFHIPSRISSGHLINSKRPPRNTLNDSSINLTINMDNLYKDSDNAFKSRSVHEIRVLLVDDESLVRKSLARFLNSIAKQSGLLFEIEHAENGFECLSLIYKYHREGKFFDALIIDENMPYLRGSQIIRLLRGVIQAGEFLDFSIISYTSYDSPEMKEYLLNEGANYVINKPVKFNDFKGLIYEAVHINQ